MEKQSPGLECLGESVTTWGVQRVAHCNKALPATLMYGAAKYKSFPRGSPTAARSISMRVNFYQLLSATFLNIVIVSSRIINELPFALSTFQVATRETFIVKLKHPTSRSA